jgi:hypothetical protein
MMPRYPARAPYPNRNHVDLAGLLRSALVASWGDIRNGDRAHAYGLLDTQSWQLSATLIVSHPTVGKP